MFIAHLPMGYVASTLTSDLVSKNVRERRNIILIGMFFSIMPDLDLFYFYFIDGRQHLHHTYWTHMPIFWVVASFLLFAISLIIKSRLIRILSLLLVENTLIHLFLDTAFGGIFWFYPFSDEAFTFVTIPAIYDYWVLNFVFHWSFLIEIGIVAFAVAMALLRAGIWSWQKPESASPPSK